MALRKISSRWIPCALDWPNGTTESIPPECGWLEMTSAGVARPASRSVSPKPVFTISDPRLSESALTTSTRLPSCCKVPAMSRSSLSVPPPIFTEVKPKIGLLPLPLLRSSVEAKRRDWSRARIREASSLTSTHQAAERMPSARSASPTTTIRRSSMSNTMGSTSMSPKPAPNRTSSKRIFPTPCGVMAGSAGVISRTNPMASRSVPM